MEVGRGNNSSQEQVLPALVARSKLAKNHCCCESIVAFCHVGPVSNNELDGTRGEKRSM